MSEEANPVHAVEPDFDKYVVWFASQLVDPRNQGEYLHPEGGRRGSLEDFHSWYTKGQPHDSVRDMVMLMLQDPEAYEEVHQTLAMSAFRDFRIAKEVEEFTKDPDN